MSLSPHNEEKVQGALALLVDATPVGTEFDDLTDIHLAPRRQPRPGVFVFAFAFVVVALLGGIALWATRGTQPPDLDVAAGAVLTWEQWLEQTQAEAIQVHDSPLVLQGGLGPEPQFDVTGLGDEQTLNVLTADSDIDWTIFEATALHGPVLVTGWIPGPIYIGVAWMTPNSPTSDPASQPSICSFDLDRNGLATGCHSSTPASNDLVDYGATLASTEDPQGNPDTLTITTPPGASVVAINVNGQRTWQRPNGNMATLTGTFTEQQVDVVIYDAQGNILHEDSVDL